MKRTPLARRTALVAKSELKRTTALVSSPVSAAAKDRNQRGHRTPGQPRNTGPSAAVRRLVAVRSQGWCEWAGCWLVASDVHHRLNRKVGGRRGDMAARINQAAWLLHACRPHHDAVTSPVGAARELAIESGWLLLEGADALAVPVLSRHGRVWLTDDGLFLTTPPMPEEA